MSILYTPDEDKQRDSNKEKNKADKNAEISPQNFLNGPAEMHYAKKAAIKKMKEEEDASEPVKPELDRVQLFYQYNPDLPFFTQFPAENQPVEKL
jgi:hypothetical protein